MDIKKNNRGLSWAKLKLKGSHFLKFELEIGVDNSFQVIEVEVEAEPGNFGG